MDADTIRIELEDRGGWVRARAFTPDDEQIATFGYPYRGSLNPLLQTDFAGNAFRDEYEQRARQDALAMRESGDR